MRVTYYIVTKSTFHLEIFQNNFLQLTCSNCLDKTTNTDPSCKGNCTKKAVINELIIFFAL